MLRIFATDCLDQLGQRVVFKAGGGVDFGIAGPRCGLCGVADTEHIADAVIGVGQVLQKDLGTPRLARCQL